MRAHLESDSESDSSWPSLQSVSNTSDDDEDSPKRMCLGQALKAKQPETAGYQVSELTPLSISPAWDEINAQLNIRMTGPDSLQGLCDEAHFARSRLTKTSSALLNDSTQAKAALFCLEQITDEDTTEDLRFAFAKLLPHSLSHASQLPELTTNIQILLIQHATLYKRLPLVTTNAIEDYLRRLPTPSGSQKPRTAAGVVPKASPTPQYPPSTVPTPSTKATTNQKASTTPTSSTVRRMAQKLAPSSQPPTIDSKHRTPSQPQPVPRTFLVPSHSAQTQPSPSTSQEAPTSPQSPASTGSKISNPSQPQPTSCAPQSSVRTQPPSNASQKPSTVSLTPEQPNVSQPAITLDPKSSTVQGPPTTSGATFSSPYPSKSFTSAQSTSDSSQRLQGPSRHGNSKKGPWK